jgi:hypothetical protein
MAAANMAGANMAGRGDELAAFRGRDAAMRDSGMASRAPGVGHVCVCVFIYNECHLYT